MKWSVIIKAGLLAGTLDISAACVQYYMKTGNNPDYVLKYVASGAFGKDAFTGGIAMSMAGLFFHYLIAFSFTLLFFFLYRRLAFLSVNKVVTAILYGTFIWVVMNLIVVPLSKIPPRPFSISGSLVAAGILIVCIALPLTLIAGKKSKTITS